MVLRIQSEVVSGVAGEPIRVVPTGAALGATVKGVDLKDLHDAMFARIMQAWHDYSVLLFRDQTVTDQELMAFSRRLGDFDWAPIQETGRRFVEGLPEIFIVSNVKVNGVRDANQILMPGETAMNRGKSYDARRGRHRQAAADHHRRERDCNCGEEAALARMTESPARPRSTPRQAG